MSVLRPRTFLGRPLNLEEEEIGQDRHPPLSLPTMPTCSTTAKDAAGEKTKHFNLMILLQKLRVSPPNNSNVYFKKSFFFTKLFFDQDHPPVPSAHLSSARPTTTACSDSSSNSNIKMATALFPWPPS